MLLWCATVILNGTVAFYGGAWLGRWLLAAPEIGAAGGLLNHYPCTSRIFQRHFGLVTDKK